MLYVLLDSIFLILFNTAFFLIGGTDHPTSVWISYAFIHAAYAATLVAPALSRKGFFGAVAARTTALISTVYFTVELVVGTLLILVASDSIKGTLLIQMFLAGAYLAVMIVNGMANKATTDSVSRREEEAMFLQDAASRVKVLADRAQDKAVRKALQMLRDDLHASPVRSCKEAAAVEQTIYEKIGQLENAVRYGESAQTIIACADSLTLLVADRNRLVRIANRG